MHAAHDDPVADDTRLVALLRLAATGDAAAQIELARESRRKVLREEADEIVCSIEGLTYARLAAAQGVPDGLMLVADHSAHLAKVYYECDENDTADMWLGQSLAALELATELLPTENANALADQLVQHAEHATPNIMREAKLFRDIFAPAFGPAAFA